MRARLALLSIVLLLAPGVAPAQPIIAQPTAQPGDLKVDFRAAPGTMVRYRIDTVQSRQKDGEAGPTVTATQTAEVAFRVLSTRDDGYRMSMNYEKVESKSPQMKAMGIDDAVADKIGGRFSQLTVVYLSDLEGSPTQLENLADLKEVLLKNVATLKYAFKNATMPAEARQSTDKMLNAMEQLYGNLTPEQANQLMLEDIKPLFGTTGINLPRDAEIHFDEDRPWALTGTMLKTKGTLRLTRQDAAQAVVEMRTGYDRDSVRAGLALASKQLAAKYDGTVPENLARTLQSMENYDEAEIETTTLRLADGWPDSVVLDRQVITGPERRLKRTVATRLP